MHQQIKYVVSLLLLWGQVYAFAQQYSLCLFDIKTNRPVTFAFIYSDSFYTTSDSSGVALLPFGKQHELFTISHISYKDYTYKITESKPIDTVFLIPISFELTEVSITSVGINADIYKRINRVIKKYQKSKHSEIIHYDYLLRTIRNGTIVERINANIIVDYKVGDKNVFPNKWLNYGNFEFNEEVPFLALELDKFVFDIHPFYSTWKYSLISSKKIIKRKNKVSILDCNTCSNSELKILIEADDQDCVLLIDMLKHEIIRASYNIRKQAHLPFYGAIDGSLITFEALTLNYEFDGKGLPKSINGEVIIRYFEDTISTKFLFNSTEKTCDENSFYVLGHPHFQNIYEQLICQPNLDFSCSDTFHFFSESGILSKFNDAYRKIFIESPISFNESVYLSQPIDSLPFRVTPVTESYYFDEFGKLSTYKSKLMVYQPIGIVFNNINNSYSMRTTYPIIDIRNSRLFTRFTDPYYNQWAVMLVCYLYEADRRGFISTGKAVTIENSDSTFVKMEKLYDINVKMYNELLDRWLLNNEEQSITSLIISLVRVNDVIDSIIGFNVFEHIIKQDYGCMSCKEELISKIIEVGYIFKAKKLDAHISNSCFQLGLFALSQQLREHKKEQIPDNKLIGAINSRMAHLMIELSDIEGACRCLREFRLLWKEGFNLSPGKDYYKKHCNK